MHRRPVWTKASFVLFSGFGLLLLFCVWGQHIPEDGSKVTIRATTMPGDILTSVVGAILIAFPVSA
jgi:uncharacterized membrane protein